MYIYHYSDKDFNGKIKPRFFGLNGYTKNSEKSSGIKRAYFYLDRAGREYYFEGVRFLYIARVSRARLYDLNKDILRVADNKRIKDLFSYIKRLGYIGVIGNNGFKAGVIFYPVKIFKRLTLTKGY